MSSNPKHHMEKTIPLSAIDRSDNTYRITTRRDIKTLAASIELAGLIHPPLLIKKNRGYAVLSGFRRVAACESLKREEMDCRIILSGKEPDLSQPLFVYASGAEELSRRDRLRNADLFPMRC